MGSITSGFGAWNGLVSRRGGRVRGRRHPDAEDDRNQTAVPKNIDDIVKDLQEALTGYREGLAWEAAARAAGIPRNRQSAVLEYICENRETLGIAIRSEQHWMTLSLARQ